MNPILNMMVNRARDLSKMFPGYFEGAKHDHYADFGFPTDVSLPLLRQMYARNGMLRSAVSKTIKKTWETAPMIIESEEAADSPLEKEIESWFKLNRFWQKLAAADRMSLYGGFSGVVLRYADDKALGNPVESVRGGLEGLVNLVPVWAGDITVDQLGEDGEPETYLVKGVTQVGSKETSQVKVHRDRLMIWSEDGTMDPTPQAVAGYNDLMTMEKIAGAGGEGFWKNAKSSPVLQVDKDLSVKKLAEAMGVEPSEVADTMDEKIGDWQKGFDQMLLLQGIKAETLGVTLPQPEQFYNVALQSFAASWDIPQKILVGSQTGERASTEDAREWALTNQARRTDVAIPQISEFTRRLVEVGVLGEKDWGLDWAPLTDSSEDQKLGRAKTMSEINKSAEPTGELVYTVEEIRVASGYEAAIEQTQGEEE